jgi:hypothetical protein
MVCPVISAAGLATEPSGNRPLVTEPPCQLQRSVVTAIRLAITHMRGAMSLCASVRSTLCPPRGFPDPVRNGKTAVTDLRPCPPACTYPEKRAG